MINLPELDMSNTLHILKKYFTDPVNSVLSLIFMGATCSVCTFIIWQSDCNPTVALWAVLPFMFATFLCLMGTVVESYLIYIGKPYQTDTVPLSMAIRRGVIPFVSGSKLVFVIALCVGVNYPEIMDDTIYIAIAFTAFVSPMEFFELPYGEPLTKVVCLVRLVVILFIGPSYGGVPARIILLLVEIIPLYCVKNINYHTASGSTIFHILNAFSYFFLYLAIDMVNIDASHPCYAQDLEKQMYFPWSYTILLMGAGYFLGTRLNDGFQAQGGYEEIEDEDIESSARGIDYSSIKAFPGKWT